MEIAGGKVPRVDQNGAGPSNSAASGGVAAAAARAAAAAKAVSASHTVKSAAKPSRSSRSPPAGVGRLSLGEKPTQAGAKIASVAAAPGRGPQQFSMDAEDDEVSEPPSPSGFNTLPLLQATSPSASPNMRPRPNPEDLPDEEITQEAGSSALTAGLNQDEQREYDEIEASFQRFKQRQSQVEHNVHELLNRLNTRVHVPSSVASSECGDLTSLASSEWDTESLGPTEDGLSMLGSACGSPSGSPREQMGPLQQMIAESSSSGLGLQASDWQLAAQKIVGGDRDLRNASSSSSGAKAGTLGFGSSGSSAHPLVPSLGLQRPPPQDWNQDGENSQQGGRRLTSQLLGALSEFTPEQKVAGQHLTPRNTKFSPPLLPKQAPGESSQRPGQLLPNFGVSPAAHSPGATPSTGLLGCSPTPPPSLRAGTLLGTEDEELQRWQGWTVVATPEGRLFFHNEMGQLSQWNQPAELRDVLGEWTEVADDSAAGNGGQSNCYWRNELLRISLWKDPRHTTNIFQAALDGNIFFMQLYAEVEGQLNVVDPKGRSALHYACAGGATQSALLLIQRQAEVDRRDEMSATPLIFACRYGYASVVKVLLDAQADLNAACEGGNTALHEAASMGQLDCLHLLLLCGADATQVNDAREAPVDLAVAKRHQPCVTLLRRHLQNPLRPDSRPPQTPDVTLGAIPRTPERIRGPAAGADALGCSFPGAAGSTAMETPCTTSSGASDPFGAVSSSSDACHLGTRGVAAPPWAGLQAAASASSPAPTGVSGAGAAEPRRGRRRASDRGLRAEYSSDEGDSDAGAQGTGATNRVDGATSSSSDAADTSRRSRRKDRSSRGNDRRRDRSETSPAAAAAAPAVLNKPGWLPRFFGGVRRIIAGPIKADLGLENRYRYNEERKRWELPDADDEDDAAAHR